MPQSGKRVIQIDLDRLEFDDLEPLLRMAQAADQKETPSPEIVPLVKKIVVGGTKGLKLSDWPAVLDAMGDALANLFNPVDEDTGKNSD